MPLEDVGELTLKGLTQPVVAFNACRSRLPHRPSVSSKEAHRAFDWGRCTPSPSNPPMAEMGVWAGIAAGDAEGPLWVEAV